MRDPKRIDKILKTIRKVWKKYPDMRLSQLLINVESGFNYYTEDEPLLFKIEATYLNKKSKEVANHVTKKNSGRRSKSR